MKRNVDSIYNNNNQNGNTKNIKRTKPQEEDDPLDSILGEIKTTQQGKYNNSSRSTFSLENVISKIMEMTNNGSNCEKLEVEGRVGLIQPGMNGGINFKPGMIQDDWERLREYLASRLSDKQLIKETDYIYDNHRVTYSEDQKKCIRKEAKTSKITYDQSSSLIYDFRISLCWEESSPPPLEVPTDWKSKREKMRYTFRDRDWKIDLTRTMVYDQFSQIIENPYEVEIELYPQSIKSCIGNRNLPVMMGNFIQEVRNLIAIIQPPGAMTFPDVLMEKVTVPKEIDQLRDFVFAYLPEANKFKYEMFPGSMPINFGKKHIYNVQSNEYYVSEKTDGIRYMLLILASGSYFIDRKFEFYQIQNYSVLDETFGNGTLLDGEMVRHLQNRKPVFQIFDILGIDNQSVCQLPLSERLKIIGAKVIQPLRQVLPPNTEVPFTLLGKVFLPKHKIADLFARIRDHHSGERIFSDDDKRNHFTDGVIFTPNTAYMPYTVQNLYKWKYLDKWTIDFKVTERNRVWYLCCVGSGNVEVECREVNFSQEDLDRLKKEFLRARDISCIIAECSFQPKYGTWKFHQVRPDKRKGNYISIVMDTMESIAENLSTEELKYRIPLKPDQDQWDEEFQKLRSTMLLNISKNQQRK